MEHDENGIYADACHVMVQLWTRARLRKMRPIFPLENRAKDTEHP